MQLLDALVDSAVDGIIVIDSRGLIEMFNPAAERMFGYRRDEVVGRNVTTLMPSPYREEHDEYLSRYLRTGEARIIGIGREVVGLRRDGTTFPLHLAVGEMALGGERKFTGIVHDLTERMKLVEQLRASEEHWRSIIESAVDAIVVIDSKGLVEAFNPAAERLFGYAASEVIGRNVDADAVALPRGARRLPGSPWHRQEASKIIGIGREVTDAPRRNDVSGSSVGRRDVDRGERKFTGILHDLSARVRMEEQLREQAALVRLGEMAAVIAHEVKNPLAGIRGAVQVIGGRLPTDSRDALVVGEILTRIDTLNALIQDLLLFARPPQPNPALVDVTPLVPMTVELLEQRSGVEPGRRAGRGDIAATHGRCRAAEDRLQPAREWGASDGWRRTLTCRRIGRRPALPRRVRRRGPGIPPDIRSRSSTRSSRPRRGALVSVYPRPGA